MLYLTQTLISSCRHIPGSCRLGWTLSSHAFRPTLQFYTEHVIHAGVAHLRPQSLRQPLGDHLEGSSLPWLFSVDIMCYKFTDARQVAKMEMRRAPAVQRVKSHGIIALTL